MTELKIHIDRYIRIQESEFLSLESGIQGFEIRILAQGFRNPVNEGGGEGVLPYKGLMRTCCQPGYVFRDFCLKQVLILSIFVLNRVSFLRQGPISLFFDDKEPALMFYEFLNWVSKIRILS